MALNPSNSSNLEQLALKGLKQNVTANTYSIISSTLRAQLHTSFICNLYVLFYITSDYQTRC